MSAARQADSPYSGTQEIAAKPSFKSDSGYAIAFCTLWLLLFGNVSVEWSVPWWLQLGVVWLFIRLCVAADPMRGAADFLARFVRAGSEVMILSAVLGVLLIGGLIVYWGATAGSADVWSRLDKAALAGIGTSDGRMVALCNAIPLLAVLGGTPFWLRRQSELSIRVHLGNRTT